MINITYKDLSSDGPVEECRDLCNALMKLQADRGVKYKEILESMDFENRLKPAFNGAKKRFLYVAYDRDKPVGYIFCEADTVTEETKKARPGWADLIPENAGELYPSNLVVPAVASHLNNLYVLPEYREQHIGSELMDKGMEWLRSVPDVRYIFVHVSNGNNAGSLYEKYGFIYSHDVYDGMIDAYIIKV
ncbi:GNAT family N-acetyltransferase [Sedimentibacter saalensis]|uniref:Acetyltransferase (GNAT) family protein n=1 Tax=Sedimentibacter saalensis TaxID=130788 RepID=A0A562J3J4_9FIRM|nr:GNAT family N-acetyltransferase [Sedimentibacter saalensis]TWH77748.1 acetyltransferase (GNAT) family protein [Sedimentibacter saalensis]